MKKVYFLLPDGLVTLSSVFTAIEGFEMANRFIVDDKNKSYYNINIVGAGITQNLWNANVRMRVADITDMDNPDLIIIPGLSEKNDYSKKKNKQLVEWMIEHYKRGAELVSLCTGSFFLAATGLLNNRECTTHWNACDLFKEMYPGANLCADKIMTDNKGIYTSGGAMSSSNLILHLIEKYNGRDIAIRCAKMLAIDIDRDSQSAFVIFEGQKEHNDAAIKKIQTFIEKNIDDRITVDYLAEKFSIPKRSLVRRFKKATNNAPVTYIQRIKIEAAKRKLETNRKSVNDIMYDVGYSDIKAFRNIFKKIAGVSPIEYRKKYNKGFAG